MVHAVFGGRRAGEDHRGGALSFVISPSSFSSQTACLLAMAVMGAGLCTGSTEPEWCGAHVTVGWCMQTGCSRGGGEVGRGKGALSCEPTLRGGGGGRSGEGREEERWWITVLPPEYGRISGPVTL